MICEDCGGIYGQKVWHSTSEYRKYVWQCNNKFKKGNVDKCQTPTLSEETIKQMFLMAYNKFMKNRSFIIEECKTLIDCLVDFEKLDKEMQDALNEVELISNAVRELVEDNASRATSQEEYKNKYEGLTKRYEVAYGKYQKIEQEKSHRVSQSKAMQVFISGLETKPLVLEEWDNTCWQLFIEKAIVHRNKSITFHFYNGRKITIEALK